MTQFPSNQQPSGGAPPLRPVQTPVQQAQAQQPSFNQQTGWTIGGQPVTQNPVTGEQLPPWQQTAQDMQNALQPATQQTGLAVIASETLPQFLVGYGGGKEDSLVGLSQFIVPPRLMIRQALTDNQALLQRPDIQPGDIYLSPELKVVHKFGSEPVPFTAILQFTDFTCQNPRGVKPWIREQDSDPDSIIARRARDAKVRNSVLCPEAANRQDVLDKYVHYVEHLDFLLMLRMANAPTVPVHISFNKTGFFHGKKFTTLIMGRVGDKGVYPIFSGVYNLRTISQTNDKGTFYNFDVSNAGWVPSQAEFELYKGLYEDMRAKREAGEIQPQYEDDSAAVAPGNGQQVQAGQQAQGPPQQAGQQQWVDPNSVLNQAARQQGQQGQPGGF